MTHNKFLYETEMAVRVGDLNYGAHLANDKFLLYFHEARVRFLDSIGLSEMDIGEGVSLTQVEAHIEYKSQVFLADRLVIALHIEIISRTRFKVVYEMRNKTTDQLTATGYTVLAGFNYKTGKPCRIPESFQKSVKII